GVPPEFAQRDPRVRDMHAAAVGAPTNSTLRPPDLDVELFVAAFAPPPRILLLGGGPDARPVATLAEFLGWRVTVVDHRAADLAPALFAPAVQLIEARAADLASAVRLDEFAAAVVMSHHLESDLHFLRALASS